MTAGTSIEPQRFRDLMAGVCAPVTVVTTTENGQPYGAHGQLLRVPVARASAGHRDHSLPRLDGAAGWIICQLYNVVEGGDHQLLLGHVTGASRAELPPLVYAHRTFGTHSRYEQRPRPMIVDQIAACAR